MTSIARPSSLRINGFSLENAAVVRSHASPFGGDGAESTVDLLQDRWLASFSTTPTTRQEAAAVEAWLTAQRRGANTTPLHHFARPVPLGTIGRLHPVYGVVADAAQGASSVQLATVAGATLCAGDMLGIGGLLVQVAADCAADAAGLITVPLANRLRRAITGLRRASAGTFVDADGLLQTAAANAVRYAYGGGANLGRQASLVAGPGVYGSGPFVKTATANLQGLQPGEVITLSAMVRQDAASAAAGGNATVFVWAQNAGDTWTVFASAFTTSTSGQPLSVSLTLPSSASDMVAVGYAVYHMGSNTSWIGEVRADDVMLNRGSTALPFEPYRQRLLVEPAVTNLLAAPEAFDSAAWTKQGTTVTPGLLEPAPNGVQYVADAVTETAVNEPHNLYTVASSPVRSFSVFVKPAGVRYVALWAYVAGVLTGRTFDLGDGVLGAVWSGAGGLVDSLIKPLANGWFRIGIQADTDFSVGVIQFSQDAGTPSESAYVGNTSNSVYLWGAQNEAGPITSYTPTTRAADVVTVPVWNKPSREFRLASRTAVRHVPGMSEGLALDFVEDLTS